MDTTTPMEFAAEEAAATAKETAKETTPATAAKEEAAAAATTTTTTTITSLRLVMVESKPIIWVGLDKEIPIYKDGKETTRNSLSMSYYKIVEVLQRTSSDVIKGLLSLNNTPTIGVLSTLIIGSKCKIDSTLLHEGDEINGLLITQPCYKQNLNINKLPEYGSFTTNCLLKAIGEKQIFEAETHQTKNIDELLKSL